MIIKSNEEAKLLITLLKEVADFADNIVGKFKVTRASLQSAITISAALGNPYSSGSNDLFVEAEEALGDAMRSFREARFHTLRAHSRLAKLLELAEEQAKKDSPEDAAARQSLIDHMANMINNGGCGECAGCKARASAQKNPQDLH